MQKRVIACALLVVLAGCGGATTVSPTDGAAPTSSESHVQTAVSAYGSAELPVDPTRVFARVLNLTNERVNSPLVKVEDPNSTSGVFDRERSPFRTALGIVPATTNRSAGEYSAYTPADGETVYVNELLAENATVTESTLAHEFAHVVQFRAGWAGTVWGAQRLSNGELDYDSRLTYYLVLEGGATYVERHYVQQYLRSVSEPKAFTRPRYENASAHARLNLARYTLGARYVADVVDSPADLASVHLDPPVSTEQVLHRTDDPVADLRVGAGEVGEWTVREREQQGELFLRIALRTELNKSTAVDAAAGWGNDQRITYERENQTGTVWVLRLDDAENATEFENAFEQYLDAKATREGSVWHAENGTETYRLDSPGSRTTVVYLGTESFVRAANASVNDGSVTVGAD